MRCNAQRAHLIHGRDSRIARLLLRGDTLPKIEKAMKLGFDSVICTHLVALYVLHKNLDTVVPELRGEDCTLGTVSVSGKVLRAFVRCLRPLFAPCRHGAHKVVKRRGLLVRPGRTAATTSSRSGTAEDHRPAAPRSSRRRGPTSSPRCSGNDGTHGSATIERWLRTSTSYHVRIPRAAGLA